LFVLEIIFFFLVALVAGLAISYPIYKFGTLPETTAIYKVVVSLGLVLLVLALYIYRFIKSLKEEKLRLIGSGQKEAEYILRIVHSYHKLFPRWLSVLSQTIYYIFKRLLRGTIILVGFYYLATLMIAGSGLSSKALTGLSASWYISASLLFVILLILGLRLIFHIKENIAHIKTGQNDIITYILLPFRSLLKYFIDMFELFIILILWITFGIDFILKLSQVLYTLVSRPVSPGFMPELPLWVYLFLVLLDLITITLIFETGQFLDQSKRYLVRTWFILLSGAQLLFFYFCFFAYLIYKILL
ncbi:MAG: hypothetical protein OEZ36_14285, partial [Spirochaetota bacterium]|nr:hypothetical protein [Spirochaetota bacterium]